MCPLGLASMRGSRSAHDLQTPVGRRSEKNALAYVPSISKGLAKGSISEIGRPKAIFG